MTVLRINEFYAMPQKFGQLKVELMGLLPKILDMPGCESCELLSSTEGQDKAVIIEKWSSIEAHQAAARLVDPQDFQKIVGFLKGKPTGKYYKTTEY
jgi:quinol monooxygenase YgiN